MNRIRKNAEVASARLALWEEWAQGCGLNSTQVLRLGLELAEQSGIPSAQGMDTNALLRRCREVIRLGCAAYREQERSIPLTDAAQAYMEHKTQRRPRTQQEIRSICKRFQRVAPEFMQQRLRGINPELCRQVLEQHFATVRQRQKARMILHGIFAFGQRQGWCSGNPLQALELPKPQEQAIFPLSWSQLNILLRTARLEEHRPCMPPLGLMLWAGVRPAEVCRLSWCDLDWEARVISVRPLHSKTGGCRRITITPALAAWLQEYGLRAAGPICPPNWARRWKKLRETALPQAWQQDVLRHTYASYHAKHWHDFRRLQEEMGHGSAALLRTRYQSMQGVTAAHARVFWQAHGL